MWGCNTTTSTVTNQIWTEAHIGTEIMTPVKNSNFSIVSGLNIKFDQRTYSHNQKKKWITLYHLLNTIKLHYIQRQFWTNLILECLQPMHTVICSRYNKWQACVGAEYQLSGFLFQTHDADNSSFDEDTKTVFNDIGIVAGIGYSFSKHIGVGFDCFQGFIGKYNYFEDEFYPTLGVNEYRFKSFSVDLVACW